MTQAWEYIKIALMNIRSNKGRSVLTMLGIIIGITSVIMILSIGDGVKGQVSDELNALAGGLIGIYVNNEQSEEEIYFDEDDFEAIREKIEGVKGVTPVYTLYGSVIGRKGEFTAYTTGGSESMEFYQSEPIVQGRYFTAADYYAGNRVCVITQQAAKKLFGTTDVTGLTIEVTLYGVTQDLTIVGIRQDSASAMFSMYGNMINIEVPLNLLSASYGQYFGGFTDFYVISESPALNTQITQSVIRLMESRHDVRNQGVIMVQNMQDQISQINSVMGSISIFVVIVAAISLLVGGIGVMNIMLVSVTERTREIGIRKSLGARTGSILLQFLAESAVITLIGGLIGIVLGVAGAQAVGGAIGFSARISAATVLGASAFSAGVGIFFGIYPARKAARLSPIEALRHE
ncbi:MAG TPA: ABC transporter permease [Candidatus Eisenbergiella stercorigallinarum]|uniref:ABC transporter permease n=1 Tax=Candidatus Eisenbergiella stercorigallinarum TaxID=2838557 RepID=A0A9D2QYQ1_9FIRM|nr:ABC transporter permease [Candidatus Eisenbergiella stercorigallinarum]